MRKSEQKCAMAGTSHHERSSPSPAAPPSSGRISGSAAASAPAARQLPAPLRPSYRGGCPGPIAPRPGRPARTMSPRPAGNRWAGGGRGRGFGTTTTPPPPPPAARGPRTGGGGAPEGREEGPRASTAPRPRRAPPPRGWGSRPSEAGWLEAPRGAARTWGWGCG